MSLRRHVQECFALSFALLHYPFFSFRFRGDCVPDLPKSTWINEFKSITGMLLLIWLISVKLISMRYLFVTHFKMEYFQRQQTVQTLVEFTQSLKQFIIKRPQGNKFFSPIPGYKKCSLNRSVKITLSMNFKPEAKYIFI